MRTQLPEVREIAAKAFPEYTGRRFSVQPFTGSMPATSYWSGGSKDDWCLLNLATDKTWRVPENGSPYSGKAFRVGKLPANIVLVRHTRGTYCSLTIFVNPANLRDDLLPPKPPIEWAESVVLCATYCYKNTYGGRTNIRFTEARETVGITEAEWNTARTACIAKGWLNRAGAITDDGLNLNGNMTSLASLKRPS